MVENLAINKYTVVINIQSQFQHVSASVIMMCKVFIAQEQL